MPDVPQYDWSKLKPATPFPRQPQGTKNFPTYSQVEPKKNSKHGAVKITKKPKANWETRMAAKDYYDTIDKLRDIT